MCETDKIESPPRTRKVPLMPCARSTNPMETRKLFENFEDGPLVLLGGSGLEELAHGAGGAALLADHLAEIVLGDGELVDGGAVLVELLHLDLVGLVHERLGDVEDEIFH